MVRTLIISFIISSIIYPMDIYTDIGVDVDVSYNQKRSKLNPDNIFGLEDGFNSKGSIYYKNSILKNEVSFDIVNFLEYDNKGEVNNKILELYGTTEIYGNFFDIGKKKSVRGISIFKDILEFSGQKIDKTKNNKDLKYKEGKIQLNYEIFTNSGVLGFSYYPETSFNNNITENVSSNQNQRYETRFTGYKNDYEYTIMGIKDKNYKLGGNLATRINDNLEFYIEGAYRESINRYDIKKEEISPDLFKVIGIESSKKDDIKLIIGNNFSKNKISIRSEYFYNKSGYNRDQWQKRVNILKESTKAYDKDKTSLNMGNLGESFNLISNNGIGNIGRQYFMTRGSIDDIKSMDISAISILSLQDLSGMVIFSANYILKETINIKIEPRFSFGNEYSEYKLMGEDYNMSLKIGWNY